MNRDSVFSENELETLYEKLTNQGALLLSSIKEVNEDSRIKESELSSMISLVNAIQMKLLKWIQIRRKIRNRVNI